jgi:hypothetical protein
MGQKLFCTISSVILLAGVSKVSAVESLSAIELASHCKFFPEQADSIDGEFCIRYIQGFIDGAIATDERVLLNIEAELEKEETYSERAARVRGIGLRDRAARYAEFCLGDPVSLREVVSRVVSDLKASNLVVEAMAGTVVYTSLRKHYPCEPDS